MNLPPALARAIAFVVGAAVFVGIMLTAGFAAGHLSDWVGVRIHGWPAWALIAFIASLIGVPFWLSRVLHHRDQKREATDRVTR